MVNPRPSGRGIKFKDDESNPGVYVSQSIGIIHADSMIKEAFPRKQKSLKQQVKYFCAERNEIMRHMKQYLIFLLFYLANLTLGMTQDIPGTQNLETIDVIRQISTNMPDNILSFQMLNRTGNYAFTQQVGNQNTTRINQMNDPGSDLANQSVSIQHGTLNEMTVGQIGNGNTFLGFQLGYLAAWLSQRSLCASDYGSESALWETGTYNYTDILTGGERNKLTLTQEGINNYLMAVQMGDDNFISAGQRGSNNYLMILQRGVYNSVTGYEQRNTSETILFDTIVQEGERLSLSATGISGSRFTGNTFIQTGTDLSLQVNNDLINQAGGGMEVRQTGRDMNIVVDQSYFSFPMK